MDAAKLFDECLANVPNDIAIEIDLSFDIADKIAEILAEKGMTQKEFAALIGKKESEVSKWLTGTHNFTLRTIAKITDALNEPVVEVVGKRKAENKKECVYFSLMPVTAEFIVPAQLETYNLKHKTEFAYAKIN